MVEPWFRRVGSVSLPFCSPVPVSRTPRPDKALRRHTLTRVCFSCAFVHSNSVKKYSGKKQPTSNEQHNGKHRMIWAYCDDDLQVRCNGASTLLSALLMTLSQHSAKLLSSLSHLFRISVYSYVWRWRAQPRMHVDTAKQ